MSSPISMLLSADDAQTAVMVNAVHNPLRIESCICLTVGENAVSRTETKALHRLRCCSRRILDSE